MNKKTEPTVQQLQRKIKRLEQQVDFAQSDAHKWYEQMNDMAREREVLKATVYSLETTLKNNKAILSESMEGLTTATRENMQLKAAIRTILKVGE